MYMVALTKKDENTWLGWKVERDAYIYFPLMSVSEAARYLGVSRKTIYRLIEWDELRAVKDGKTIRIEKRSLDAFRESGKLT